MKNTFIRMAAIAATVSLLTACLPEESNTGNNATDTTTTPATILVTNTDGGKTDITGTWVTACFAGAPDLDYLETFSGNTYKLIENSYATSDGTCGGAATVVGQQDGTFVLQADVTATGWIDGSGVSTAAPIAQNSTTTLPATPSATNLLVTFTSSSGTQTTTLASDSIMRIVDASVANNIALYDIYDDGVNGLVGDSSLKATRQ